MRIKFYIYNDKCKPRHIFPDDMDLYPTSQSINNQVVYTEIVEIRVIKNKKVDFKKNTRFLFVYLFHRFDEKKHMRKFYGRYIELNSKYIVSLRDLLTDVFHAC